MESSNGTRRQVGQGRETASPGDIVDGGTFIGRVTKRVVSTVQVELDDGSVAVSQVEQVTIVQRFAGPSSAVQCVHGVWLLSAAHMMARAS